MGVDITFRGETFAVRKFHDFANFRKVSYSLTGEKYICKNL